MSPAREQLDGALRDLLFGQEALEKAVPEKAHQLLSVDPGDWIEGAVLRYRAVGDQAVEMWLEVDLVAVGLDRDDTAGHGPSCRQSPRGRNPGAPRRSTG